MIPLAAMASVLGGDIVVGGQRKRIFTDTIKRDVCSFFRIRNPIETDFQ